MLCSYDISGSFMHVRDAVESRLERIEVLTVCLRESTCKEESERETLDTGKNMKRPPYLDPDQTHQ